MGNISAKIYQNVFT